MKRVIITGSPRSQGRSAHVAEMLFEANIDERPEDELFLVPVSEIEVGPCIGCNACRELSEVIFRDDDGTERAELRPRCVFDDDMQTLYDLLDEADELTVVSPVYFSGAPAPLKCLLDRMQPYFWANARKAPKRPATLHVLGEGGDPHGYDALVSEVKSSLACAGFRLITVFDWVGKVTPEGEITAEADEIEIAKPDNVPTTDIEAGSSVGAHPARPTGQEGSQKNSEGTHPARSTGQEGSRDNSVGAHPVRPSGQGGSRDNSVGARPARPQNPKGGKSASGKKQRPKLDLRGNQKKGGKRG